MDEIINVETVRNLISIQVENKGSVPHEFTLFYSEENRNSANFGNHMDVVISLTNRISTYSALLSNTQSAPLKVVNTYCSEKRKLVFYRGDFIHRGREKYSEYKIRQIGKVTASPFPASGKSRTFVVDGSVSVKPDGWKLQPKEKIVIDFEVEHEAAVQEHIVKPTSFIKLWIENKSNEPRAVKLFNANLNAGDAMKDNYGNRDVEITWETSKEHYSSIGKSGNEEYRGRGWDTDKPRRVQNYNDLLVALKFHDLVLRVVNIFSDKKMYWSFTNTVVGGGQFHCRAKQAFPYPVAHYDKNIFTIDGSATLERIPLAPYEKTFIELEVEQE